ncbi:hypothetical protein VTL71DRAFT_337 [Oculimacula yallundae]|uniref:Uncharacterized protein n=1 Tax=Oculimacula yallundae TaxID=86028 RepID=A0ABR4D242_9HELO
MLEALIVSALLCPLLLTAQIVTVTVKCSSAASLCAETYFNNTMALTTLNISSAASISESYQESLASVEFLTHSASFSMSVSTSEPSAPSSTKPTTTPSLTTKSAPTTTAIPSSSFSTLTRSPSSTRTPKPVPPPPTTTHPASSPPAHTESCICLTTGPLCAPQSTPRRKIYHPPPSKSTTGPPLAGTACPTSKDILLQCDKVGKAPKVEKCKFMGFGFKVHCAESKVGVDSCGGM